MRMRRDPNDDLKFTNPEADRRLAGTASLWSYLPQLLHYPLCGYALGVTVVMGVLFALCIYAGIFGIAMLGLALGWLGFYLLEIVGDTAAGHAVPPPLGTEIFSEFEFGRIGLLLTYVIFLVAMPWYFAAFHHQHAAGWLTATTLFLLPAVVALLALEDHAWQAFNPVKLPLFIIHTGLAYLLICAVMLAALAAALLLGRHLASILAYMLLLYCLILICHALGFVAYHRQDQLGLTVAVAKPTAEIRRREAQQATLAELLNTIDMLTAANNSPAAARLILAPVGAVPEPRLFYQELFETLRTCKHTALALLTGAQLVGILLREKRMDQALNIYEQCLDITPMFEPRALDLCVPLAQAALETRRYPLFEKIIAGVRSRHAATTVGISLGFLRARYLAEVRHDEAAAIAGLQPLLAESSHPWHARIAALYRTLGGGAAAGASSG